mgnify:CR=1 FL=1
MAKLATRETICTRCGSSVDRVDGKELRAMRVKMGWTIGKTCKALGMTLSYLCDVELNRRNTTDRVVNGYLKLFKPAA